MRRCVCRVAAVLGAGCLVVMGSPLRAQTAAAPDGLQEILGEWRWKKAFADVDLILRIDAVHADGRLSGAFDTQNWGKWALGTSDFPATLSGGVVRLGPDGQNRNRYQLKLGADGLRGHFYRQEDQRAFSAHFVRPQAAVERPASRGVPYVGDGASVDLHAVYWGRGCDSALLGFAGLDVLQAPAGVTLSLRPGNVQSRDCGRPVPGGTIVASLNDMPYPATGVLNYTVRYKTAGGDQQSTHRAFVRYNPGSSAAPSAKVRRFATVFGMPLISTSVQDARRQVVLYLTPTCPTCMRLWQDLVGEGLLTTSAFDDADVSFVFVPRVDDDHQVLKNLFCGKAADMFGVMSAYFAAALGTAQGINVSTANGMATLTAQMVSLSQATMRWLGLGEDALKTCQADATFDAMIFAAWKRGWAINAERDWPLVVIDDKPTQIKYSADLIAAVKGRQP